MNLSAVQLKTHLIQATREFFEQQGFLEICTPVLHEALPLEPNLYAFKSAWKAREKSKAVYLAVSPEVSLKKMMAAGVEQCFTIAPSFRNLEASGSQHTPEFLMLEWYRPNSTYVDIMRDTQNLIGFIQQKLGLSIIETAKTWPKLSMIELWTSYTGIELPNVLTEEKLFPIARQKGYQTENATWSQIFDQIFLNEIEPHLPTEPFFLTDFPARVSPLCEKLREKPGFAQRFELYINTIELANGNTENLDATTVEAAFKEEKNYRHHQRLPYAPIDQDFLKTLSQLRQRYHSLAGMGVGIDRLTMLLSSTKHIQEVSPLTLT